MAKRNILGIARDLIIDVIKNNTVFSLSMKAIFKQYNLMNDEKNTISAIAGCELRHHLIFQEIAKRAFGELTLENAVSIYVALANVLFVKKIDETETLLFVYKTLDESGVEYSAEEVKNFFETSKNTKELIPSDYQKNSIDFLSLRFNTPKWLVKMWKKVFGESIAYKILKANSRPPLNTCALIDFYATMDEVLENPELFTKGYVDNTVVYLGKSPIKKQRLVEANKIYPQKLAIKHALDNIEFDPFKGVAVYQGYISNIYLEPILKTNRLVDLDIIVSNYQDHADVKNKIKLFDLKNTHLYMCEPSSIITCVSRPVNTFVVAPKSSNFDLLRTAPDYFMHFKPETLDLLIKNQYTALTECSNFIEEGGQIVYMIPTISLKEGQMNIQKFVNEHEDFVLEYERQYFPFDPYDSSLYVAVLRKAIKQND